jgi:hypothetical protein
MSEPLDNIGMVCGDCRRQPSPAYLGVPLAALIGKFCKLAFRAGDRHEYMWVEVLSRAETPSEELRGRLANDPVYAPFQYGDLFEFKRSEIIDVYD